jgi:hypothetical protein
MRHQLKYVMMCSLPSITYIKIAPITTSSAVMYNQNGISAIGDVIIGGETQVHFDVVKCTLLICSQVNSASFFNRSIGANALIFPDKLKINPLK